MADFLETNEIELTKSEFDIVELLSLHPGQVFDLEMIMNDCGI